MVMEEGGWLKMRMWKVNPKVMCRQHLLGEHVEMHMFVGCWNKGIKLNGYLEGGLVELCEVKNRHDELANRGQTGGKLGTCRTWQGRGVGGPGRRPHRGVQAGLRGLGRTHLQGLLH